MRLLLWFIPISLHTFVTPIHGIILGNAYLYLVTDCLCVTHWLTSAGNGAGVGHGKWFGLVLFGSVPCIIFIISRWINMNDIYVKYITEFIHHLHVKYYSMLLFARLPDMSSVFVYHHEVILVWTGLWIAIIREVHEPLTRIFWVHNITSTNIQPMILFCIYQCL